MEGRIKTNKKTNKYKKNKIKKKKNAVNQSPDHRR